MGDLTKDAQDVALLLNALSKIVNHQGLLPALWASIAPVEDLLASDFSAVKAAIQDPAQRQQAETAFKASLSLVNQDVQAKLVALDDCLEQAISIVEDAVGEVKRTVDFINQLKVKLS